MLRLRDQFSAVLMSLVAAVLGEGFMAVGCQVVVTRVREGEAGVRAGELGAGSGWTLLAGR